MLAAVIKWSVLVSGKMTISQGDSPDDDVRADLRKLGFTEYEARIYVQLLRQDEPSTAYEISKNAGVPRPNSYNALENLTQRGAVLPVSEQPTCYVATPPEDMMSNYARQTAALCTQVSARLKDLSRPVEDRFVWTINGDDAVRDKIDTLIDTATQMLLIKAPDDILRAHKSALVRAGQRGVAMLIVVFGPDTEEFRFGSQCRTFIHEGNGVRMGSTDNLFTITADHREMITARMNEDAQAVHSRNQTIVNVAESLIRHDYYMAEIFLKFAPQIDAVFGQHLRDLRLACFTPEQAQSFRAKTGL